MSADPKLKEKEEDEEEDEDYDPEAPVVSGYSKIIDLPEIPVVTGEEGEELLTKFRSKIYRWRKEWKERGVGELKFIKHKKSGLIRILVRADKTHKCVMNHLVNRKQIFCQLEQLKTSNNSWTWAAYDISDETPQTEKFCAKFTSKEDFDKFKTDFETYCAENEKTL